MVIHPEPSVTTQRLDAARLIAQVRRIAAELTAHLDELEVLITDERDSREGGDDAG